MVCGIGNIRVSSVLEEVVINFKRIRQVSPQRLTLSSYTMAANCASGARFKGQFILEHEMWANAQRDGRPLKHRWRPLFNAAKFG